MKNLVKIFPVYSKENKIYKNEILAPIQTGIDAYGKDLGVLKDNTEDNIANKNLFYGELTANYWVWKNYLPKHQELEYIGFCHYRRFFDFFNIEDQDKPFSEISSTLFEKSVLSQYKHNKIYNSIKDYDIVLSKKLDFKIQKITEQVGTHSEQEVLLFKQALANVYPEYESIANEFINGTQMYMGLLFVMKTELFNDWMNWIFNILKEYDKLSNYKKFEGTYQVRMPAFMAERFFNVWLNYKIKNEHIKVHETKSYLIIPESTKNKRKLIDLYTKRTDAKYKYKTLKILGVKINFKKKNKNKNKNEITIITQNDFEHKLLQAYKKLEVQKASKRPRCINFILPHPTPKMSAGPLSIYCLAKKLMDFGYNIRLLPFVIEGDTPFKEALLSNGGEFKDFADKVEVDYSLIENKFIYVNPDDMTVATWFTTAYYAKRMQSVCTNKKFIYMIQDYESQFFPHDSMYFVADATYNLDYYGLFSTKVLEDFFMNNDIGGIKTRNLNHISYPCPANSFLPSYEEFLKRKPKKQFVYYARAHAPRNAYELSTYAIIKAVEEGIMNPEEWEFWGVGAMEKAKIALPNGTFINQLPNMNLEEYKKSLNKFDLALSLMGTPHTSMPPVDLALSGSIVVTNTGNGKTQQTFDDISKNIIAIEPTLDCILEGFKKGVSLIDDYKVRYENATSKQYPDNWTNAFTEEHKLWFQKIMEGDL